ncbi:hypothetical protein TVAG_300230 [Trichomonas vaginalis G3]|uniref:Uncharacterized protein n=1 Tax=Trichomonas vaginalis (strain ATCC PRA-98 / G3) TaxID=412133 RepID=A2FYK1_TRIV3|nr:hypothetical protein TVAGG3_0363040 [Trichomonas vaginalis G3]EAX90005.1 hypothetical protein TVAG_300230 [Trichomonas vaginalis G3]KAI5532078.1 hypothetical protein TVAGG3_0363040 [Trichomonas vaginalis G3]|eukprot:XP_001302935.1 hypothetical protein [Trichomonas vaginalis G3]
MNNAQEEIIKLAKATQKANTDLINQRKQIQITYSTNQKRLLDIQNEFEQFSKTNQSKELQKEYNSLSNHYNSLQQENNGILEEIEKIKELFRPAVEKYCQEREMCKDIKAKKLKATSELEKLNEYIKKVSTTVTLSQQNAILKEEFAQKEKNYLNKIDKLQESLKDLQYQLDQIMDERSKAKFQVSEQISTIKALEERKDRRDNSIDKLDRSIREKTQEYNDKDDYLNTLKKEKADVQNELENVLNEITKTRKAIKKMQLKTAEAEQKKLEAAAKFAPLEKAFTDKINEIKSISKQKFDAQLEDIKKNMSEIDSTLIQKRTEYENASNLNKDLKDKVQSLQKELNEKSAEQERILNDLNIEKAQLAQKLAEVTV